jgi:hypothetical protein
LLQLDFPSDEMIIETYTQWQNNKL